MQYASPTAIAEIREERPQDPARLPINTDVEASFLGALLIRNGILEEVSFLLPEHFSDPIHAKIFTLARDMLRKGRTADITTIRRDFEGLEPIHSGMTAPQYLAHIVAHACTTRAATSYARTIVDLAIRRSLILAGEDLVSAAKEAAADVSPLTLIEETEAHLFALAQEGSTADETAALSFAGAARESIERAYEAYRGGWVGLKTGLPDLDGKLGGLQNSDLIVLAGRPSMGKTSLATNIAFHVAKSGQAPVLFFSLEMGSRQLTDRILGEQVGVPAGKMRNGSSLTEAILKALAAKAVELSEVPLYIDAKGGSSIVQICARSRRAKRKHKVGLIIIDYIQLMQAVRRERGGNRVQDITEITTGLKALAKELDLPIIALSQLSRNTENRENKRPQLADLRESGSIEQDADVVMFCYREEYYVEREQPSLSDPAAHADWQARLQECAGKADIIIGKHRHGETATVPVAFNGELTRFSSLAKEARYGL